MLIVIKLSRFSSSSPNAEDGHVRLALASTKLQEQVYTVHTISPSEKQARKAKAKGARVLLLGLFRFTSFDVRIYQLYSTVTMSDPCPVHHCVAYCMCIMPCGYWGVRPCACLAHSISFKEGCFFCHKRHQAEGMHSWPGAGSVDGCRKVRHQISSVPWE